MAIDFKKLCILFLCFLCSEKIFALPLKESINPCGDESWVPYKTIKCFKLLDHSLVSASDGASICSNMSSSLLTIDSAEEQEFISTYAFVTRRVVDNVWLAAHRIPQTDNFRWDADHSLVHSDFWAPSTPSPNQGKECLQMTPHMPHFPQDTDDGLWMDTSCHRRNLVICQKQFRLTQEALQKLVLKAIAEIEIQKYNSTQLKEQMDKMGVGNGQLPVNQGLIEEMQLALEIQRENVTELKEEIRVQKELNERIELALQVQKFNGTEMNLKLEEAREEIRAQQEFDEEMQLALEVQQFNTSELSSKLIEAKEEIRNGQELNERMESALEVQRNETIELRREFEVTKKAMKAQQELDEETQMALFDLKLGIEHERSVQNDAPTQSVHEVVPVGFIYVEYPSQAAPSTLWPSFNWTEVTSQYSGKFFRALGGNSGSFGTVQDQSNPVLTITRHDDPDSALVTGSQTAAPGTITAPLHTGRYGDGDKLGLKFQTSNAEVRPINTAIKIWKRSS